MSSANCSPKLDEFNVAFVALREVTVRGGPGLRASTGFCVRQSVETRKRQKSLTFANGDLARGLVFQG